MKYFWEEPIVSIEKNIVTFKGGVQKTFSPVQLKLVTDKKSTAKELRDRKLQYFQAYIFEAFDLIDLNYEEFMVGLDLIEKKWKADIDAKVNSLLWVNNSGEIKYSTIHR